MRQVLAVALLDCRRLGFGLSSGALVAGLVPSLASGLGGTVKASEILTVAFVIVGIAAGEFFGSDFAEGKSSFYFARPLPTWSLVAGRFVALVTLAAVAFVAFMASFWISSNDRSGWSLSILTLNHVEALGAAWSVSLFLRLAVAAHGRAQRSARGWRELAKIPMRLGLALGAFILIFGLFADLLMRAYAGTGPLKLFFGSWFAAALLASLMAVAAGRTEGLRIARVQSVVMVGYVVAASIVVITVWSYVLHPGPEAIETVSDVSGSPDGRVAYLRTSVGRGDPDRFHPTFVLDLASGLAHRLDSDPGEGPWTSADGATMVWGEATPIFFRPFRRFVGGSSNLRVKTRAGDIEELPVPQEIARAGAARDVSLMFASGVSWVLPSADGSVFALRTWFGFTFTSRSGAQLSKVPLDHWVEATTFLESGALRVATLHQAGAAAIIEFLQLDPRSGGSQNLGSIGVQGSTTVQLDGRAERALVTTGFLTRPVSITLVNLGGDRGGSSVVLGEGLFPTAGFLADGRIVAATGGGPGLSNIRRLRTFSSSGQPILDIPMQEGETPSIRGEVFPGIVGVQFQRRGLMELALFDVGTGAFVRRLPGFRQVPKSSDQQPPPGTPAARLILSGQGPGGKLYDLPSLDAEPRLILPLPRS